MGTLVKTEVFCLEVEKDTHSPQPKCPVRKAASGSPIISCKTVHPRHNHRLALADGLREERVMGALGFFDTQISAGEKCFSRSRKSLLLKLLS